MTIMALKCAFANMRFYQTMSKIEAVLNCLFGCLYGTKLYSSPEKKTAQIGTMLYSGSKDCIIVEQFGEELKLTGLAARFVFSMI